MVAGILSINIPTSNKKILINRRTIKLLLLIDNINEAIFAGICSIVKSAAKAVDRPTINVVAPFTTIASLKAIYAPLKFNSLYIKTPTTKEYTTDITAASVGVNFPE